MREIMVRCPETGKEIPTGIWCDGESFARLPFIVSHASCPVCGKLHGWSKADAWLSEPELEFSRPEAALPMINQGG
jgi:hypothetical protein